MSSNPTTWRALLVQRALGLAHFIGLGRRAPPAARTAAPVATRPSPSRGGKPAAPMPAQTRPASVPRPHVADRARAARSAGLTAAQAKGNAEGVAAMRDRWAAVYAHPLALQHPRDAAELAADDGLTVAQVHAMLGRFPDRAALGAERAGRNPRL